MVLLYKILKTSVCESQEAGEEVTAHSKGWNGGNTFIPFQP